MPKNFIYGKIVTSCEDNNIKSLEELEQAEIIKALKVYGSSKKGKIAAAKALGIGIATLYRKIDKIGDIEVSK